MASHKEVSESVPQSVLAELDQSGLELALHHSGMHFILGLGGGR